MLPKVLPTTDPRFCETGAAVEYAASVARMRERTVEVRMLMVVEDIDRVRQKARKGVGRLSSECTATVWNELNE